MSEATTRGRPSSVEMFKQRHQAYAVANEARMYFGAARNAFRTSDYDQAGFYAGEVVGAAEANPQARKMLGDETIEEARSVATESNKRLANAFGSAPERDAVCTARSF